MASATKTGAVTGSASVTSTGAAAGIRDPAAVVRSKAGAGAGSGASAGAGNAGGRRRTTTVPDAGGGDKSPATPAANDSVLSAKAAAKTRMSSDTATPPASTESVAGSRSTLAQGLAVEVEVGHRDTLGVRAYAAQTIVEKLRIAHHH